MTIFSMFPKLPSDIRALLGKEVEIGNWDCHSCGGPFFVCYLERPDRLGVRCAQCSHHARSIGIHDPKLLQLAAEALWGHTISQHEEKLGHWVFDEWFNRNGPPH
jgi:hypothetical protein